MVCESVVLSVVLCEVNVFSAFNILKFTEVLVCSEFQIEIMNEE